ncbi:MAG: phosphorylase [Bacteroidales bacterium]
MISTGIGTDNIDIVLNELDALVNVDLTKRRPLETHRSLRFLRLGTSGALQEDLETGTPVLTKVAGGLDGLLHFYRSGGIGIPDLTRDFVHDMGWDGRLAEPYFVPASPTLSRLFDDPGVRSGITLSTPGFYAPQVRSIRLPSRDAVLLEKLAAFRYQGMKIMNFEMESSALYALSALLGHEAVTLCVAIGNRLSTRFMKDYKVAVDELIDTALHKLAGNG